MPTEKTEKVDKVDIERSSVKTKMTPKTETMKVVYVDGECVSNQKDYETILKDNKTTAACTPLGINLLFGKKRCYRRFADIPPKETLTPLSHLHCP